MRFLGTVPETDVLVVTHKRNMRSRERELGDEDVGKKNGILVLAGSPRGQ